MSALLGETSKPVFYDPSGGRQRWARRGLALVGALVLLAALVFAFTLVSVSRQADLPLGFERSQAAPLSKQIDSVRRRLRGEARQMGWLPPRTMAAAGAPVRLGFYAPWDPASAASLQAHLDDIDWLAPATLSITGPRYKLETAQDPRLARILAEATKRPVLLPMVQNAAAENWDGEGTGRLLANPAARAKLAADLSAAVVEQNGRGLVFDLEALPAGALADYRRLIAETRARLPAGRQFVAVTLPAGDEDWQPRDFAPVADRLILMDYDEHWNTSAPGPIASQSWFVEQLHKAVQQVGAGKMIVAIGSYAYNWTKGDDSADPMSIEEAWLAAHDSEAKIVFDPASGNPGFGYDEDGKHHDVWMLDAATAWNQLRAVQAMGVQGVALWRLGSEDPGIWPVFDSYRGNHPPDLSRIAQTANTDVEGTGEILRITQTPQGGSRQLTFDKHLLVRGETYQKLPTPYVVERTGARDKLVALTFDDGPDANWTPQILDILETKHVPATFFIVGESALEHPGILRRIVADGSELGNHTYTHPNLALVSSGGSRIEMNATQRLIQAYTGRSTRLFRAPYFGDAEPTTADELGPALIAQQQGYTIVGLHADPNDWQRPGADAIVQQTINAVTNPRPDYSQNIVLLHDGGGDRAQTVAALPRLIDELHRRGYRFVPVSTLAGLSMDDVMPRVTGTDLAMVRADIGIFAVLAALQILLRWAFFLAITLGIVRGVSIAVLALTAPRRTPADPSHRPSLSVIIPAYNEARVIEASVRRILASDYPGLELIVADDGSTDGTSDIVRAAFGDHPQVQLLTLANGGKAAALNRALARAHGEVIIALDADTQFEPDTISRLAAWFADPAVGAVAGNAKVGNRHNLVTRWQAVEYVTAQNLERRALARFAAMMVVPGAVGAWRRAALDQVGGYPEDTLAEDQDMTIAIQRAGWRVDYDCDAVAWTEAPESFAALSKQRYRWAFGTLQCLWKHRRVITRARPPGLAFVGMPQAWAFQIVFAAISPLIDLALVASVMATGIRIYQHGWAQTQSDVLLMAGYWLVFTAIDVGCGFVAYRLDTREPRYPMLLLVAQRFVYRQIMYWVVLRAIRSAVAGWSVGWGKLERTGRVAPSAASARHQPA
ncbi:glycosyltransferase [Sphingomonas sp.]|uniref:glycosyltransferase n=1 Tax=Sphingomonas sp. TaxID=28214 RepID=UPI001DCE07E9|nr:glycosyltransferase [Sphingomonas sp.]MBX9797188.1 glycosyltransferase [Sphingomonas sp.]